MHWLVIVFATIALVFIAVVSFGATARFAQSEQSVAHTHEVETALMSFRSNLFASQDALLEGYVTGDPSFAAVYHRSEDRLAAKLQDLRRLTSDNPAQGSRLDTLAALIQSRRETLRESGVPSTGEGNATQAQRELFYRSQAPTTEALAVLDDMRGEEERLLQERTIASGRTYTRVRLALASAYAIVVLVLFVYFRGLLRELRNRQRAEEALRRLSGRILQLQDAERRKIARELHDSFGQTFAALKMNLDRIAADNASASGKSDQLLSESLLLLDRCISEARTLSHLLHPPLLDELGFASAAEMYIEGFSDRSRMQVNLDLPKHLERMPGEIELTLFRALQESLTNIHRHSGSSSVEIRLERRPTEAVLTVRDHGKGISAKVVEKFTNRTGGTGVGLAGLRERVRELEGQLSIRPAHPGTLLRVSLPLPEASASKAPAESPSVSGIGSQNSTAAD